MSARHTRARDRRLAALEALANDAGATTAERRAASVHVERLTFERHAQQAMDLTTPAMPFTTTNANANANATTTTNNR